MLSYDNLGNMVNSNWEFNYAFFDFLPLEKYYRIFRKRGSSLTGARRVAKQHRAAEKLRTKRKKWSIFFMGEVFFLLTRPLMGDPNVFRSWCSHWSTPFPPPAPQRFSPHCSPVSQVLCCCPTSVSRSYQSYGISPSLVDPFSRKNSRISRFPCKRCPHMPGSKTPPGRSVTRIYATARVAFPSGPCGRHPRAGDFGAQ